jgi:hypothetical protein
MSPSLKLLRQPSREEETLAAFLRRVLADPGIDSLTIVVAWARFGGLARVQREIEAFKARGGASTIILGIDAGGATRPGLLLAAALFDEAFVFHDPAGGTFHPKLYLAGGSEQAFLVVGSSNATAGGLFGNYEASLEARFTLPDELEDPALTEARAYVDELIGETELCLRLNTETIDRLVRERRYRVAGNERRRKPTAPRTNASGDASEDPVDAGEDASDVPSLFGTRQAPRARTPALDATALTELVSLEIASDDEAEDDDEQRPLPDDLVEPSEPAHVAAPSSAPVRAAPIIVSASWSKVLPKGDAQQVTPGTNPTGNLRLTKAKHDIDWTKWFRDDLFGSAAWRTASDVGGKPIEVVDIPFAVTIAGVALGQVTLQVTHAAHRESGQHNHTTVLRWGPLLPTMRATDYTKHTVTLARLSDGSFALDVSP